eukprot:scaffold78347_cov64-Phaeocystis_antarctica.AAC.2
MASALCLPSAVTTWTLRPSHALLLYTQADAALGSRGSGLTDCHIYRTDATGSWIRPSGRCEQASASQQPHPPPPRPCFSCGCGGGGGGAKQD